MGIWSVVSAPFRAVKAVVTAPFTYAKATGTTPLKAMGAGLLMVTAIGAAAVGGAVMGGKDFVVDKYKQIRGIGENGKLVMVNGTDKDWKIVVKRSNMNKWDGSFPETIKSGEVKTVEIEFNPNATNSEGEVNYQIVGTDQNFNIRAKKTDNYSLQAEFTNLTAKNKPKGSTIPLGWKRDGNRQFILAGRDGNYTGSGLNTENWMNDNLDIIGDRRLMEICIPGSHDSGMSRSTLTTPGANDSQTLTHTKNISGQLALGSRFFDIRPVMTNGSYYTAHLQAQDKKVFTFLGATGQPIDEVINQFNEFTNTHKELVILNLSHAMITNNMLANNEEIRDFNQADWDNFLIYLNARLKNLIIAPANADLSRMKLNELLKDNQKVIVLLAEKTYKKYSEELKKDVDTPIIIPTQLHGKGFFKTVDNFNIYDDYANRKEVGEMSADQLEKLDKAGLQYFLLSWTLTQDFDRSKINILWNVLGTNDSVLKLASEANDQLAERVYPEVNIFEFPNIIYTDDIRDDQQAALAMAINWKRTVLPNYGPKPIVRVYDTPDFKITNSNPYEDFNEVGKLLPVEKYVKNDTASSIKVSPGYKVTLYENADGSGKQVVINGDTEYYYEEDTSKPDYDPKRHGESEWYKNHKEVRGFKGLGMLTAPNFNFNDIASALKIESNIDRTPIPAQVTNQPTPTPDVTSNNSPMAPAHAADSCAAPADNEVIVYEHVFSQNGGGKCVKLKPGEYRNAVAIGLADNIMSSIKVGVNVRATVCDGENFVAPCEDFDKTDDDLTNNATIKNDTVSSIKVIETKTATAEAKPEEVKALSNGLAGDWTDGNETVKFTETMAEFKMLNAGNPYNTSPYKVIDGKTVEFTFNGRSLKAIMTFEDNGSTLIWYRPDQGKTYKYKRAKG